MTPNDHSPPPSLELTGEYLKAMETVSAHLMHQLPSNDTLWRILGQTEALLLEAQMSGTPVSKVFPKGGVAGFCQSIVDEQAGKKPSAKPSVSHSKTKEKKTSNAHIKRKKNTVTGLVIAVWILFVALLVAHYTGFLPYLLNPHTSYLEELHNFDSVTETLTGTESSAALRLDAHAVQPQVLYHTEDYTVTLTAMGTTTDDYSESEGLKRYWVELCYTRTTSFSEIRYVSPAETGVARMILPDGESLTHELHWHDDGIYDDGTMYVRLCFLELPRATVTDGGTVEISFDPMVMVKWFRTGVGSKAG